MPIRIKNPELVALFRELGKKTGRGPTELLLNVLRGEARRYEARAEPVEDVVTAEITPPPARRSRGRSRAP